METCKGAGHALLRSCGGERLRDAEFPRRGVSRRSVKIGMTKRVRDDWTEAPPHIPLFLFLEALLRHSEAALCSSSPYVNSGGLPGKFPGETTLARGRLKLSMFHVFVFQGMRWSISRKQVFVSACLCIVSFFIDLCFSRTAIRNSAPDTLQNLQHPQFRNT